MKQKLLLVQDVEGLGKKGEVAEVRVGYARNYLVPQGFAIPADPHTLRMQQKLQEERSKQALVDKKDAEELAKRLTNLTLTIHVKVDPEGKMYGSVAPVDIAALLQKEGFSLEKKNIGLKRHVKETGVIEVPIKLKEGVESVITLKVLPEVGGEDVSAAAVTAPITTEKKSEEEETEEK